VVGHKNYCYMNMCGVNLKNRVPSKGLREGERGLNDKISILQENRLQCVGVL